jgi:O-antigen ligase
MAAILGLVALLPLVPDAVWNRVLDPKNYSSERSATLRIRFEYWSAGLDIIGENPITGIGVGNQVEIPKRIKGDAPDETTAHNEYIMTGMEVGVLGWLVFFGFVGTVFWASLSASRMAALVPVGSTLHPDFFLAIQIAMTATLIYGMQVDVFHFPLKGWWLIAGISWAQYLSTHQQLMAHRRGVHVSSPQV